MLRWRRITRALVQRSISGATISQKWTQLWQVHLIETYGPGCALICRMHHSLADGVVMMHAILSVADAEAGDSQPSTEQEYSQLSVSPCGSSRS